MFACIVVDHQGRVLLRKREGSAWAFPRARFGPGESPEEAGTRAIEAETGCFAEPLAWASSDDQDKCHLLMRAVAFYEEFEGIRWVAISEAERLLAEPRDDDYQTMLAATRLSLIANGT